MNEIQYRIFRSSMQRALTFFLKEHCMSDDPKESGFRGSRMPFVYLFSACVVHAFEMKRWFETAFFGKLSGHGLKSVLLDRISERAKSLFWNVFGTSYSAYVTTTPLHHGTLTHCRLHSKIITTYRMQLTCMLPVIHNETTLWQHNVVNLCIPPVLNFVQGPPGFRREQHIEHEKWKCCEISTDIPATQWKWFSTSSVCSFSFIRNFIYR